MENNQKITVRFAPSPTGQLHIGGARTALFNFLFAKHHGGQFYLRIEDTDIQRSKQEYTDQIYESMKWLGLKWDGDMLIQSERFEAYQTAIQQLLSASNAYRCFCTKEELDKIRNEGSFQYSGTCRHLSLEQENEKLNSGYDYVVRIKVNKGTTSFSDLIFGDIHVNNNELDDFIIARSDGSPTYNLVVVVDDHEMGITHVIRGEDHINNTPKQILIYDALGYSFPTFAHLPMILGQDKKRLSKRHGAPGIQQFRDDGYLPEALLNYLALLGWNPETEQEIFTFEEMIVLFKMSQVNKKGAVYDEKKLDWICGQHIMNTDSAIILTQVQHTSPDWGSGFESDYLLAVIDQLKQRSKTLLDIINQSSYFFYDPEEYDEKAARKNWKNESTNELIQLFSEKLKSISEWNIDTLNSTLRLVSEENSISAGKIIHPSRLALSGISFGPSLFAIMEILGKDITLRRLNKACNSLPKL